MKRCDKLTMLFAGQIPLLQENFADGRNRQRCPNVGHESVAQRNEVMEPSVGRFVTDELQLTPNPGAMQGSQHVPEGGGAQATGENHAFRLACRRRVGQIRHPARVGEGSDVPQIAPRGG